MFRNDQLQLLAHPWELPCLPSSLMYVPPAANEPDRDKRSKRLRQLTLPEMMAQNHNKKRVSEEHGGEELESKRKRFEPGNELVSTCSVHSMFHAKVPLDIIGVVVDFYCADVNDAAELATISTSWREAVVASLMWTQRVEPIMRRNPFPLLEREHLAWHWDCSDAVHLALLVEYIMNFWLKISEGNSEKLIIWIRSGSHKSMGPVSNLCTLLTTKPKLLLRLVDRGFAEDEEDARKFVKLLERGNVMLRCVDEEIEMEYRSSEVYEPIRELKVILRDEERGVGLWINKYRMRSRDIRDTSFSDRRHAISLDKPLTFFESIHIPPDESLFHEVLEVPQNDERDDDNDSNHMAVLHQLRIGLWREHIEQNWEVFSLKSAIFGGHIASRVAHLTHLSISKHIVRFEDFAATMEQLVSLEYLSMNVPIPTSFTVPGWNTQHPKHEDGTQYEVNFPKSLHTLELFSWMYPKSWDIQYDYAWERRRFDAISDAIFENLAQIPELRRVAIEFGNRHLTEDELFNLSQCESLETLMIRICSETVDLEEWESAEFREQYAVLVGSRSRVKDTLHSFHLDELTPDDCSCYDLSACATSSFIFSSAVDVVSSNTKKINCMCPKESVSFNCRYSHVRKEEQFAPCNKCFRVTYSPTSSVFTNLRSLRTAWTYQLACALQYNPQ